MFWPSVNEMAIKSFSERNRSPSKAVSALIPRRRAVWIRETTKTTTSKKCRGVDNPLRESQWSTCLKVKCRPPIRLRIYKLCSFSLGQIGRSLDHCLYKHHRALKNGDLGSLESCWACVLIHVTIRLICPKPWCQDSILHCWTDMAIPSELLCYRELYRGKKMNKSQS